MTLITVEQQKKITINNNVQMQEHFSNCRIFSAEQFKFFHSGKILSLILSFRDRPLKSVAHELVTRNYRRFSFLSFVKISASFKRCLIITKLAFLYLYYSFLKFVVTSKFFQSWIFPSNIDL